MIAGRLEVTMGDRDRDLFVAAENHLRIGLAAALIVNQRIVNAAKTHPGFKATYSIPKLFIKSTIRSDP